jgi:hypothetical protein
LKLSFSNNLVRLYVRVCTAVVPILGTSVQSSSLALINTYIIHTYTFYDLITRLCEKIKESIIMKYMNIHPSFYSVFMQEEMSTSLTSRETTLKTYVAFLLESDNEVEVT